MVKVRKVVWSIEAQINLDSIFTYLERDWTEKEVRKFAECLENQLLLIVKGPEIYKKSLRMEGVRECQITFHNTLFYTFDDENLYIVTIFDNRQDSQKLRD